MKLLLLTLFILCFSTTKLPAQDINKNFCSQFGIKLGMNASNVHFTQNTNGTIPQTKWILGPAAGFFITIPLAEKLSLQPEYLFSSIGSKINDSTFRLNYLSLPVLLKYDVANKLALVGGGTFDLLLWVKEKGKTSHESMKGLETRNIGITGGLEFHATEFLDVMLRYMGGLNHVDDIYKEREFKNRNIQLTAAIKL